MADISNAAAQQLVAVINDYMLLPIEVSFNWDEYFESTENGVWYLVAFRSKHRPDANEALLTRLDTAASNAAREMPGFRYYFIGVPRSTGECLSFCLWDSQFHARAASTHSAHRQAVEEGVQFYEYYALERYVIQKDSDGLFFRRL